MMYIQKTAGRNRHRGIAMMLVLICLSTATIVTVSYLSSRDNSAQIGLNIADSTSARWAAISGVEMGIAIMETNTDWRNNHASGKVINNYTLGAAKLNVSIMDMKTNAPPNDDTTHFEIISNATAGGVTQSATAFAMATPPDTQHAVDVDLSEFAVYAGSKLIMENLTTIGRWATAPYAKMGRQLALASQSGSIGTVDLRDDAAVLDAVLLLGDGASDSAVLNTKSPDVTVIEVSDPIPAPAPPTPPMIMGGMNYDLLAGMDSLVMDSDFGNATVRMGGDLTLMGPMTVTVDGDFNVESNSIVRVTGDVVMAVRDSVSLANSAIELQPGSTLTMFVGQDFNMDGSYVGDDRLGLNTLDNSGYASYVNPNLITVYGPAAPGHFTVIEGNSVFKGSIYNPMSDIYGNDQSAIYGRIAGNNVILRNDAAVFYDHALDEYTGFANRGSQMYDEGDHSIRPEILALASLNDADLQALADSLDLVVTRTTTSLIGDGMVSLLHDAGEPAQPTPRPLRVAAEIRSVGFDHSAIEGN